MKKDLYIQKRGIFFLQYTFLGISGNDVTGRYKSESEINVLKHFAAVHRDLIIVYLEKYGIDTEGMHSQDIGSFLSKALSLRNLIHMSPTPVITENYIYSLMGGLRKIINKLNDKHGAN